jgi:osmotically-inducible protein OsmY
MLSAEVRWHFQCLAAEQAVQKLGGVREVRSPLPIKQVTNVNKIKDRIAHAL